MAAEQEPEPVTLPSADGRTVLIGYLWRPKVLDPAPAVVMLHGRSGAYSVAAEGVFNSRTLSKRHRMWGQFWSDEGYVALHVDSFGPRGHVAGFSKGSYANRPPEVSEKEVRPLDAYGALAWLQRRKFVRADAIGLRGWSNGAMAALWAMSSAMPSRLRVMPDHGFQAALAFYPGCSRVLREEPDYKSYAPVLMLLAGKDQEVRPQTCQELVYRVQSRPDPGQFGQHTYPKAEHNFDDPDKEDRNNSEAREDAKVKGGEFFNNHVNIPSN